MSSTISLIPRPGTSSSSATPRGARGAGAVAAPLRSPERVSAGQRVVSSTRWRVRRDADEGRSRSRGAPASLRCRGCDHGRSCPWPRLVDGSAPPHERAFAKTRVRGRDERCAVRRAIDAPRSGPGVGPRRVPCRRARGRAVRRGRIVAVTCTEADRTVWIDRQIDKEDLEFIDGLRQIGR